MAGNDALHANPTMQGVAQHITVRGSDWLWAVFAIMVFTDLVVFAWHLKVPRGQRLFHQLALFILTTASIAYFSMASNLGYTGIATEFGSDGFPAGVYRQIWYVRYIDWVITTPCLLLELVLASGLPLSDIMSLMFFDLVMIVTGLVGALVVSSYKWAFWAFGTVALFYIWWVLFGPARQSAGVLGAGFKSSFTRSAGMLSFLWLLYPIAWGLADGANVISPDSEMVFYGVLDVLAKPVFTLFHLYGLSKLDLTALQLSSGKFSASAVGPAAYDHEKAGRFSTDAANAGTAAAPAKKGGLFARRAQHDATAPAAATSPTAAPRTSEHTVVGA